MFYVYILRTSSNTLYIGQTNNLKKRLSEHKSKSKKSAKYMRYFTSFKLVYQEKYKTRAESTGREAELKRWPRKKKEELIVGVKKVHIAIMRKSWGLTQKILTGEKTIESRWYMNRAIPWGRIGRGDTVYFKDSGEPVRVKATVDKVIQIKDLTPKKVKEILDKYSRNDGLGVNADNINYYFDLFKNKKYCILVFLKNPKEIKPFEIDKSGFGSMASWITVDYLDRIRV